MTCVTICRRSLYFVTYYCLPVNYVVGLQSRIPIRLNTICNSIASHLITDKQVSL